MTFQNNFRLILHQFLLFCAFLKKSWNSNWRTFDDRSFKGVVRSSHLYEDKERFHFDEKFRKLYKKSNLFGDFLIYFYGKFGDPVPFNSTSGIHISESTVFGFSRKHSQEISVQFSSSWKVTECFDRKEAPSDTAELLKCACFSTENSIRE